MSHRARVLIVDHDEIALIGLEHILEETGHDTATAWGAKEAVRLLDHGIFDLLLISEHLGEIDSATLVAKVKALHPRVPVLAMHTRQSLSREVSGLGCSGSVCKWEHDDVVTKVRGCLAA